ncbi:MAG: hypothetical protein WC223_13130 [Bacteroidales bacterium]|jgi:hypothetical protein
MPINPNLIIDQDITVPFEDLFKGGYEAHKVPDMEKTYTITKVEKGEIGTFVGIPVEETRGTNNLKERLESLIGYSFGTVSAQFMSQAPEIVMPADELAIIMDNLVSDILKEVKEDKPL